jgi:hypothetical protein
MLPNNWCGGGGKSASPANRRPDMGECLYQHVVWTDKVTADSPLPVTLRSTEVLWERARVMGTEAGPLVDITSLADQRRLTVPVQAGNITWVKRAPSNEWSGQDFTTRGARWFSSRKHSRW